MRKAHFSHRIVICKSLLNRVLALHPCVVRMPKTTEQLYSSNIALLYCFCCCYYSLQPRRRLRCYLAAAFALPRRRPRCYPVAAVLMPSKYCDSVRNTVETCLAAGVKPVEIASELRVSH